MTADDQADDRALLLLDVDGVLHPYAASRRWLDKSAYRKRNITAGGDGTFPVWLNREHGTWLLTLAESAGLKLAWCTTWEHLANELLRVQLGLPELPVIEFTTREHRWKFGPALDYAGDRPLAWFDDEFTLNHADRDWFLQRRGTRPTLLHEVDPYHGLRTSDLAAVRAWASSLTATPVGEDSR